MDIFCREVKPFAPLTKNEIRFWLRIMKEHALFIYLGLPCDQAELREEAQRIYNAFEDLEKRLCEIKCGEDFSFFVDRVIIAVNNIFAFKRHLLHLLIDCKICGSCLYPLLIDHISREALYFLKLLHKICNGEMRYPVDAIVSENVFWLRIMADHLKFIRGLLDPSERRLMAQAQILSDRFDQLGLQARDLDSMLWHYKSNNELIRFEKNVTEATVRLRDFKTSAEELIKQCAALSIIPPLLADHVRREAEHFLEILELIREDLLKCEESPICCCDYEG